MTIPDTFGSKVGARTFESHPRGSFQGKVEDIVQKTSPHQGVPLWEVKVRTEAGSTSHTIWGFTETDVSKCTPGSAVFDQEHADRVQKKIASTKTLLIELGAGSGDEIETAGWNTVVSFIPKLIGKPCTVVVAPNRMDPSKTVVFLNRPEGASPALNGGIPTTASTTPTQAPNLSDIPF